MTDPSLLEEFGAQSDVPIALDETLDSILGRGGSWGNKVGKLSSLLKAVKPGALILKPAYLGGLLKCVALAKLAHDHGAKVRAVPRSTLET